MTILRLTSEAIVDEGSRVLAAVSQANLAREDLSPRSDERAVVAWSGWLGEPADPQRGVFPREFRTWTQLGWDALGRGCETAAARLSGRELWLRPHARHVLADPQACVTFFRSLEGRNGGALRLLLEPTAFLAGSMLAGAEDHIARAYEALAALPATVAVLLTNIRRVDGDDDLLTAAPLHQGLLDPTLLIRLWRGRCSLPVVLLDHEIQAQTALLSP